MNLFLPDNFSESKIKYLELGTVDHVFDDILDQYFSHYKIEKKFKLDRLEVNSENYKISVSIGEEEKVYLLRKNKVLKNNEQIDFYLRLLDVLCKSGVKVSGVVRNKNNKLSTIVGEDTYA